MGSGDLPVVRVAEIAPARVVAVVACVVEVVGLVASARFDGAKRSDERRNDRPKNRSQRRLVDRELLRANAVEVCRNKDAEDEWRQRKRAQSAEDRSPADPTER